MIAKLKGPVLGIGLFLVAYVARFSLAISMAANGQRQVRATNVQHKILETWLWFDYLCRIQLDSTARGSPSNWNNSSGFWAKRPNGKLIRVVGSTVSLADAISDRESERPGMLHCNLWQDIP
jgi:hypothetical protein